MAISFKERTFDNPSRDILKDICVGDGLDIGSADRPISKNAKTVDINRDYNPDYGVDMHNLPIDDLSQDFIIMSHVLEHTDRVISCLKEMKRVLKHGGGIGITVPNGELCSHTDLGDGMMTHKMLFTRKTLELYMLHIGFKDVKVVEIPLEGVDKTEIIGIGRK